MTAITQVVAGIMLDEISGGKDEATEAPGRPPPRSHGTKVHYRVTPAVP